MTYVTGTALVAFAITNATVESAEMERQIGLSARCAHRSRPDNALAVTDGPDRR